MKERTIIYLERDPGVVARTLDLARSFVTRTDRMYAFDGFVGEKGYSIADATKQQHLRPVKLAVGAMDGGAIPFATYEHLVNALKECRASPEVHPIRVEYTAVRPGNEEVYDLTPRKKVKTARYSESRGLDVNESDLRLRVQCDLDRKVA